MGMVFAPTRAKETKVDTSFQENFWGFSTDLYSQREVKSAMLCLETKYDLNINLLMLCCWVAERRYDVLTVDDLLFLSNKVSAWNHGIVSGLKTVYAELASGFGEEHAELVGQVLDDMILSEKIEQSMLLQAIDELEKSRVPDQDSMEAALKNVFNYIHSQQVLLHKTDLEKVYCIVKACFE